MVHKLRHVCMTLAALEYIILMFGKPIMIVQIIQLYLFTYFI